MHIIVNYVGRLGVLDRLTGARAVGALNGAMFHLYTNVYTPVVTSVIGDFTEATDPSLAALPATGWSVAALGVANVGQSVASDLSWTNTSGATVDLYGCYVTDSISGDILFAFHFDSAPQPLLNGQTLTLTPQFQADTIFTS